jgi:menaquinone-9 beta-reductase
MTSRNPQHQSYALVGGGLAGLVCAILLARRGQQVCLFERKSYPFHRVCGEYISNEVRPFLEHLGLPLASMGATSIKRFMFSSPAGRTLEAPLALGGFGLSRYTLDQHLYQLALAAGVEFLTNTTVESIDFEENTFNIGSSQGSQTFDFVVGAYGKRGKLDATLQRDFFQKKSPYVGIKYHITTDFPQDLIALHNFADGYCGISAIEQQRYCLCYLTTRENLRKSGDIETMEKDILQKNPFLKNIFQSSDFLYEKPLVINEISFAPKQAIEQHIFMVGDAAGLITPLCGNGMAMAIHGAKLLSEVLLGPGSRAQKEQQYQAIWQKNFATRLWAGRNIQRLFGDPRLSELASISLRALPFLLPRMIRATHGQPIDYE